mmetsp:Transcript_16351/g.22788  ORF Transcript_16351/g.22788 Transcript_16351/m.22788 type:complete len:655 (+) Transcript_16351:97-2061(+)
MGVIEEVEQADENPNSPAFRGSFTAGVAFADSTNVVEDEDASKDNNDEGNVDDVEGEAEDAGEGKDDDDQPVAIAVNQEELKQEIRERLFEGAPAAEPVALDKWKKWHVWGAVLTAVMVTITIVGLIVGLTNARNKDGEDNGSLPTLGSIKKRGYVRCAIGWLNELETDLCKALAAAALGNSSAYEVVEVEWADRWPILANKSVDIVTLLSTLTMDRDVHQAAAKTGFSFSTPLFYDGAIFGGLSTYLECADRRDAFFGVCKGVRVCITEGSSTYNVVSDFLPDSIFRQVKYEDLVKGMKDGTCNVIVETSIDVSLHKVREAGFDDDDYKVGKNYFSKTPLSTVVRQDDQQWADFVNWVIKAFFVAEQQNITNANAQEFMTTDVFGPEYKNMFINAISAVGNYEQLYMKHLDESIPRGGLNVINNGSTALLYAPPFGTIKDETTEVKNSIMIETIQERGVLHCGERKSETWSELGAEYCKALAASLFNGDTSKIKFIEIASDNDGLSMLDSGNIDVLSGGPVNLLGDVGGATELDFGHTFSLPYYYEGNDEIALVTQESDPKWSDFVYWTVAATLYADEYQIKQDFYLDMPVVKVFGPRLEDMFRQTIKAVGNYREMNAKLVDDDVDQGARNEQNLNPYKAQIYVPYYAPPNMG